MLAAVAFALLVRAPSALAGEGVYSVDTSSYAYAPSVSQYTIGSGGSLTPDASPTYSFGGVHLNDLAIAPDGDYAYLAAAEQGVFEFSIGAGGELGALSTDLAPDTSGPNGIVVSPNGSYAYVTNGVNPGTVSQFSITYPGGELVADATSTVNSDEFPGAIAESPNGQSVYVAAANDEIEQYAVGSNGELTLATTATGNGLNDPNAIAISPNGAYLYAANDQAYSGTSGISEFAIGSNGALSAVPSGAVNTGAQAWTVALSPNGKYAYAVAGNAIFQYTVGANGVLTPDGTPSVSDSNQPGALVIAPSSSFVYVTNFLNGTIGQYDVGSNGELTAGGTVSGPAYGWLAIAPDVGPSATFTIAADGTPGTVALTSTATDSDEALSSYDWTFGDGTTGSGASVTHTYASPGTYTVSLAVTDDAGCGEVTPLFSGQAGPFTGLATACSPDSGATISQVIDTAGTATLARTRARDGAVNTTITCGTASYQTCTGTLLLTTREHLAGGKITAISAAKKPRKTTRTVTLGGTPYSLTGGATKTLTINLNATGKKLLAKYHKLPARLTAKAAGATSASATTTLTITTPKKHRKRH